MKRIIINSVYLILLICSSVFSQARMQKIMLQGDDIYISRELETVIVGKDGVVTVATLMPLEMRSQEYRSIDINEGDTILYFNAEKVKSAKEIEKLYNSIAVGGGIKLGIKRGPEMHLISYAKIDPANLPQGQRMVVRTMDKDPDMKMMDSDKVIIKKTDNMLPLMSEGIILEEVENAVQISETFDVKNNLFKKGDIIVSMNDQSVKTIKEFDEMYQKINIGSEISLNIQRAQNNLKLVYNKSKAPEIIKKDKE